MVGHSNPYFVPIFENECQSCGQIFIDHQERPSHICDDCNEANICENCGAKIKESAIEHNQDPDIAYNLSYCFNCGILNNDEENDDENDHNYDYEYSDDDDDDMPF